MAQQQPNQGGVTLWEQWLHRLQGEISPSVFRQQLEVLLLADNEAQPNQGFFQKLAQLATRILPAGEVFIYELKDKTPHLLFTNLSNRKTPRLLREAKSYFSHPSSAIVSNQRIRLSESLKELLGPKKYLSSQLLNQIDGNNTYLLYLTDEFISSETIDMLRYLSEISRIRQHVWQLRYQARSQEERLATLIHHLSEGLIVLDKNLHVLIWNRPTQRVSGYSTNEAQGKLYKEVLCRVDEPDWLESLRALYQKEPEHNVFTSEFEIVTKQGQQKWLSLSGSFLRDPAGQIEQTIIISRDISRHKELERRKNEFISIATHELRTPITAVKGYLSLLQKEAGNLTEKQHNYLGRANDAANRLVRLAEDLLQVVHLDEDRMQFNIRPVQLLPILRKVARDFTEKATQKGLALTLVTTTTATSILADPLRIEQIFANLIDNAIKYTTKGSVEIRVVEGRNKETGGRVITTRIKDTGIGINARELQGIFEKFHRTSNAQQTGESGVGLGLYIVKSFVEKQGGKIMVRSRQKRGTTFEVSFLSSEPPALVRRKNG